MAQLESTPTRAFFVLAWDVEDFLPEPDARVKDVKIRIIPGGRNQYINDAATSMVGYPGYLSDFMHSSSRGSALEKSTSVSVY